MSENNGKCHCGCDAKDEREDQVRSVIRECKYDKSQLMRILNETDTISPPTNPVTSYKLTD